ncbi:MAG: bifunctional folylpolyglutamate synthase/dihydrofolate synthase [Candidatus Latescibacteria bacterium]|nr:bifunctional folylpolyglutamate synthase/dihydrofolate synthase [Candidatus Latescibacterota bacterium]
MTLGLDHMRALMDRLGHPEKRFRSVLIAGTNGKGSTTTMLAAILAGHGIRAGRYTSPHVFSVAERIVIDGEPASIDEMEAAAARLVPLYGEILYSYFEALTAIAFAIFAARGVEVAVLEVGLGGRLDATNVVEPEVSIVTSISLDHRRILGETEAQILAEKLGVSRPGVPLLIGPLSEALRADVDERAKRDGFPVVAPGDIGRVFNLEQSFDGLECGIQTPRADYGRVSIPFAGAHQATNALLAIGAAERILPALDGLRGALARAYIPGRFESIQRGRRSFVLDVAHNEASLIATADHLATFRPREECAIVFGLLRRKELFEAPRHLLKAASCLCLIEPPSEPGSADNAFAPHELWGHFFAPLLPDSATNVMLWNPSGPREAPMRRLMRWLDRSRYTTVVAMGSHRVVEDFGVLVQASTQEEGGNTPN